MSTVSPSITPLPAPGNFQAYQVMWSALKNGDAGKGVDLLDYLDRSMQIEGTFGAGGTVVIEGSNDGTNYHTIHDHFGIALSFTSANLIGLSEAVNFVRPRVSAGDGTTSLTATLFARKTRYS